MVRPRSGIGFVQRGVVYTGIRLSTGLRRTWPVVETDPPPAGVPLALPWARAVSLARQAAYDRGEWQPGAAITAPATNESVRDWCERWCAARESAGLVTVNDDRGRLRGHILPVIGDEPIATVTAARLEDVRDALDTKLREGVLAGATVTKTWGVLTKMFADARRSKTRTLRVRTDNPCEDIEPPDRKPERVGPIMYPNEVLALISCARVPQRWRELFTIAVYTFMRASEIAALDADAIDFDRGTISVHATLNRHDRDGTTKTETVRRVPIEPAARAFFETLVRRTPRGPLVGKMPMREDLAAYLRKCLGYAGIARAELFADDAMRRPLVFHDLRATGITWLAIRGDSALSIQERAGHTTFATTQGYVRLAESLGNVGPVFPMVPGFVTGFVTDSIAAGEPLTFPRENWRPQRDLKAFHGCDGLPSALNCVEADAACEQFGPSDGRFVTGSVTRFGPGELGQLEALEYSIGGRA